MTSITAQAPGRRPPLPILTSLRFFAALEVMVYHLGRMTDVDLVTHYFGEHPRTFPGNVLDIATSAGHEAVAFFFVLSGFVLTYVYAGPDERQGFAATAPRFWRARFNRLAPSFYLGLLAGLPFLLYSAFVMHNFIFSRVLASLVLTPTFLQSWWPPALYLWNFPSWSLSVEAFFYALFPLLAVAAARLSRRNLLLIALVFIVATAFVRDALYLRLSGAEEPLHSLPDYFPALSLAQFVLGIALGRLFLFGPTYSSRTYATIMLAGLLAIVVVFGWQSDLPPALAWIRTQTGLVGIVFGVVIFGGAGAAPSFKPLASPTLVFLGDASYSMYILHIPISLWWKWVTTKILHLSIPPTANFLITLGLVIVLASLNHAYLEPRLRRLLPGRRVSGPAPLTPAA
jgi:peptidoglycan/LPS O-acetylase OafA/YrhL